MGNREQELLSLLLSMSKDIADIRDRDDLYRVMMDKVRPYIHFDDAVVVVIDEEANTHEHILTVSPEDRKKHPNYKRVVGTPLPLKGSITEEYLKQEEDVYPWLLEDWLKKYPDFPGIILMKETDLQASINIKLKYESKDMGLLIFHFLKAEDRDLSLTALYKGIGDQVTLAVRNILANEEILREKSYKESLLVISEDITKVRSKEDLMHVIFDRMQPIFQFDDCVVNVWRDDYQSVEMVSSFPNSEAPEHPFYKMFKEGKFPIEQTGYEEILKQSAPKFYTLDYWLKRYPDFEGVKLIQELGYVEHLVFPLYKGEEKIGVLEFHAKEEGQLKSQPMALFKGACDQVAVAVTNVLANEEILDRQREKEILLGISEAMTTIRDREDFRNVIMGKIYPLINFADAVTTVLNTDGEKFKAFLTINPNGKGSLNLKEERSDWTSVEKSEVSFYKKQEDIFTFEVLNLLKEFPHSEDIQLVKKAGLRYSNGLKLYYGGSLIGFLLFHFKKKPGKKLRQELYKNISEQLAVAVSNILANEDILERQKEKETLLGISESLSKTRNQKELLNIIFHGLKPIFQYDYFVILLKLDGGEYHTHWTINSNDELLSSQHYDPVHNKLQTKGSPHEGLLKKKDFFTLTDKFLKKFPDYSGAQLYLEMGMKSSACYPLLYGGESLGALLFHSQDPHYPEKINRALFKSASEQIATAISNILANEEILREKSYKESLLAISEDITTVRSKEDLMQVIFKRMQPIFQFDDCLVNVWKDDYQSAEMISSSDGSDALEHWGYDFFSSGKFAIAETAYEEIVKYDEPRFYTLDFWLEHYADFPGMHIMADIGYIEHLVLPLYEGEQRIGVLEFHSKEAGKLKQQPMALFKGAADQVALAVGNILANEEILARQKEKETLLSISEDISNIRDREDLFRVMMGRVKEYIRFDDAVVITLSEDKKTYNHLLTMSPPERMTHPKYKQVVKVNLPYKGSVIEQFFNQEDLFPWTLEDWLKRYPKYPGLVLMRETDLNFSYNIKLKYDEETIGLLIFHFAEESSRDLSLTSLYKGIGHQVSLAVRNILANEDVLVEKSHKEALLYISEDITTVRSSQDLKQSIFKRMQPIFKFDDAVVIIWEDHGRRFKMLFSDETASTQESNKYQYFLEGSHRIEGTGYEMISNLQKNTFFTLDYWLENYPDFPGSQLIKEVGYIEHLVMPLRKAGNYIGVLEFHSKEEGKLKNQSMELFQGAADQVAVAVSNILANEEVLRREQEKTMLLQITERVNKIRDLPEFLKFVMNKLKPIFNFHDVGIFLISKDGLFHYDLASIYPEISPSTANLYLNKTLSSQYLNHPDSPIEHMMSATGRSKEPILFDFKDLKKDFPDYPQFRNLDIEKSGRRDCLGYVLQTGEKNLGYFCINKLAKNFFSTQQFSLFKGVTEQLSVAISNILANEEILRREQEKTMLLRITEQVNKIRDLPEFLKFIITELKPIFNFYDVGIFLLTEDGKKHYDLAALHPDISPSEWNDHINTQVPGLIQHADSSVEWAMKQVEAQGGVALLDFKDIFELQPEYPFFEGIDVLALGYRDCLAANLKVGEKVIGMFCINQLEKDFFKPEQFSLFKGVTEQLSVAISNILANKDILKREQEKTMLLNITEKVARLRDLPEFLEYVITDLKEVFHFYDVGIFILTDDGEYHYDLATVYPQISPSDSNLAIHKTEKTLVRHKGTSIESMMADLEKSGGIHLFDFKDLVAADPDYYTFQVVDVDKSGYRDCLAANLQVGDKVFGFFCINQLEKDFFKKEQFPLFKSVTDQLAVSISNILATDDILRRQREKEVLLKITENVSRIRNLSEFLEFIIKELKPVFQFYDVGVFLLTEDGEYHYDLAAMYPEISPSQENYNLKRSGVINIPHRNTVIEWAIQEINNNDGAKLFDFLDLEEKFPEYPQFQANNLSGSGLRDCLAANLQVGEKVIGMFCINQKAKDFFKPEQFSLFKGVTDQLSVAISNILANEDILRREQEKTMLLKITEQVNKIRDLPEFLEFILDELKQVFGFYDAGLFVLTEDDKYHYDLVTVKSSISPSEWNIALENSDVFYTPHENSAIEWMIEEVNKNGGSFLFDFVDLTEKFPDYHQIKIYNPVKAGYRDCLAANLQVGDKVLGMFCINQKEKNYFKPEQFTLFKGVTEQLSVAISNILANREILSRQQEKELLLGISEKLNHTRSRKDLMRIILNDLKPIFHFDYFVILIKLNDWEYHTHWTANSNEELISSEHYNETHKKIPTKGSPFEKLSLNTDYYTVTADSLMDFPDYTGTRLYLEMGMKSSACYPLVYGGKSLGVLMMHAADPDYPDQINRALFKSASQQIAVALSNILANEEILEREKEKSLLLDISKAIANAKGAEDLYQILFEKLQPVYGFGDITSLHTYTDTHYRIFFNTIQGELYLGAGPEELPDMLPLEGSPISEIVQASESYAVHLDSYVSNYPEDMAIQIAARLGLQQTLIAPLIYRGRVIASLQLNYYDKREFEPAQFQLLNAVADRMAVAVSNILANEEILERQEEKETLLGISEEINKIRDWKGLAEVVQEKLQPLFGFEFSSFAFEQEDKTSFRHLVFDPQVLSSVEKSGFQEIRTEKQGTPFEWFFELDGITFIDTSAIVERYRDYQAAEAIIAHQLKVLVVVPLVYGGRKLGIWGIDSKNAGFESSINIALLENTASQLSVAVSNILSTEEIVESKDKIEALNRQLSREKSYLEEEIKINYNFEEIVGNSRELKKSLDKIAQVAVTDATVLITGETGTGKELVARAIHNLSNRRNRPLVKLNCASLPTELIESELFGHEKGSFTGASERRIGKFELAHEGTIFLDEIGEIPIELQSKLLRAIQELEIERIGSNKLIKVDVRIIAATNRNLEEAMGLKQFRPDLYFRLNVFPIQLPALKERKEDILPLAQYFLNKSAKKMGKRIASISKASQQALEEYDWPGNIRELEHVIERAAILNQGSVLNITLEKSSVAERISQLDNHGSQVQKTLKEAEKELIIATLEKTEGRVRGQDGAAELLDIKPTTLEARMKKLGIDKKSTFVSDS
ncbi:MAG: GAF domain-containing protein [Bacteroidota bacterium]